jgi:hypothetical protein
LNKATSRHGPKISRDQGEFRQGSKYLHCQIIHSTYYLPLNGGVAIGRRSLRASTIESTTSARTRPTFSSSINNPRELPFGQTTLPHNSTDLSHFHSRCMAASGKTRNFIPSDLPQSVEPFTGFNFSASSVRHTTADVSHRTPLFMVHKSLSCYSENSY